ncbi:hypothetical protein [Herbidospora sp. NBRC 101105]|uniref:hypothetical protein n=1 Tax=Herbidospora sp. NBRC 101105 TaxID=3032195 RepID=UPI00255302DC|nr:hypothetical protein [Herbidospora sp. NBRC 101105]
MDSYAVRLVVDVVEGDRLGCRELTMTSRSGQPINGKALRLLPIGMVVRDMVRSLVVVESDESPGVISFEEPYLPEAMHVGRGPTEDSQKAVALSYSIASARGDPPAKSVEQDLGLTAPTAGRWIRMARDRGFLEIPAEVGQKIKGRRKGMGDGGPDQAD